MLIFIILPAIASIVLLLGFLNIKIPFAQIKNKPIYMNIENPLLTRHSIEVNHVIIEYLLKFKNSDQKTSVFLDKVTSEFQEQVKRVGTNTLNKSISKGDNVLLGKTHSHLMSNVKDISSSSLYNLKEALKRVSKEK